MNNKNLDWFERLILFWFNLGLIWFLVWIFNPNIDSGLVWILAFIFSQLSVDIYRTQQQVKK